MEKPEDSAGGAEHHSGSEPFWFTGVTVLPSDLPILAEREVEREVPPIYPQNGLHILQWQIERFRQFDSVRFHHGGTRHA